VKRFRWCGYGVAVLLLLGGAPVTLAGPDEDLAAEYNRRFRALERDDISSHYDLALWCRDQKAYRLLHQQATYILQRQSDHEPARLLLELAKRELVSAHGGDGKPPAGGAGPGGRGDLGRLLSPEEIQTLRRSELFPDRSERVRVKFDRHALKDFFATMEGNESFPYGRKKFFRLPPGEKAQVILKWAPDTFGRRMEIVSDPQRFVDFQRRVLPVVLEGCATSACHGTAGSAGWRIYDDRVLSAPQVYTNFLILHEYERNQERLIRRDRPEESLLLVYGLPRSERDAADTREHPGEIRAVYRSREDRKYADVLSWIESLSPHPPEYGISLEGISGKD